MAVPKRKVSPHRRGNRRSHDSLKVEAHHECISGIIELRVTPNNVSGFGTKGDAMRLAARNEGDAVLRIGESAVGRGVGVVCGLPRREYALHSCQVRLIDEEI